MKNWKVEELLKRAVRWYGLCEKLDASAYESCLYSSLQTRRMADELAKLRFVRMFVLFGCVAQKNAHELNDLDMIIVVSKRSRVKMEVISEISKLELKYIQ